MEKSVQAYIQENIARRYLKFTTEEYDSISDMASKGNLIVADTLAPSALLLGKALPPSSVFISETIATMNGSTAVPFDTLLKVLNIKLPDVKKKLIKLQKAQLNLILVGYGGYSINTMEFLYQLCVRTGVTDLFRTITIFEADNLTATNCFRLYKNVFTPTEVVEKQSKLSILPQQYDEVLSSGIYLVREFLTQELYENQLKGKNVVYLGAPDFTTRQLLANEKFIFGGHAGDEVGLISKPSVNMDITVESYGTINPAVLFMNLLRATVELPEALTGTYPENTVLFDYNFKNEVLNGNVKSPFSWVLNKPTTNAPCGVESSGEPEETTETAEPCAI